MRAFKFFYIQYIIKTIGKKYFKDLVINVVIDEELEDNAGIRSLGSGKVLIIVGPLLLDLLTLSELKAVILHELGHIVIGFENKGHLYEMEADRMSIVLGAKPKAMISALKKIHPTEESRNLATFSHPNVYQRIENIRRYKQILEDMNKILIQDI